MRTRGRAEAIPEGRAKDLLQREDNVSVWDVTDHFFVEELCPERRPLGGARRAEPRLLARERYHGSRTLDIEGIGGRNEVRSLVLAPHRDRFVAFLRLVTIDAPAVKRTLRDAGFTVAELKDFLD